MILQRNFEGGLHGLRAAGHIDDAGKPVATEPFDQLAELVLGIAREAIPIGMCDFAELSVDCLIDFGMVMTQTIDGRPARRINVAFACRIIDVDTFTALRPRQSSLTENRGCPIVAFYLFHVSISLSSHS
jgi:hypothetical protein